MATVALFDRGCGWIFGVIGGGERCFIAGGVRKE